MICYQEFEAKIMNIIEGRQEPSNLSSSNEDESDMTLPTTSNASNPSKIVNYLLGKYRNSLKIAVSRVELEYQKFLKEPEKHPDYSFEFKAFWQRRSNELLAQGKDATGHNYKPEWIDFWMPRMKQLKILELEKQEQEICFNIVFKMETADSFEKKEPLGHERFSRSPTRKALGRNYSRSRYFESPGRSRSRENSRRSSSAEVSNDGPINIVTVCRLLLALESELGIIAPRVVALLEQAIFFEKAKAFSSEELLRNLKNVILLDLVKEKLKGLLVSELLGDSRIAPVKKAIRNISALVHEASKLKPITSWPTEAVSSLVQPDPAELNKLGIAKLARNLCQTLLNNNSVGFTDLANIGIATVLAQILLDQGKADVSAEELAEIVDEFKQSQLDEPQPSRSSLTPPPPPIISKQNFRS